MSSTPNTDGQQPVSHRKPHHVLGDAGRNKPGDQGAAVQADAALRAAQKLSHLAWPTHGEHPAERRPGEAPFVKASERAGRTAGDTSILRAANNTAVPGDSVLRTPLDHRQSVGTLIASGVFNARQAANPQVERLAQVNGTVAPIGELPQKLRGAGAPAVDRPFVQAAEKPLLPPHGVEQFQPTDAATTRDISQNPVKAIDVRYSGTQPVPGETLAQPDFLIKRDGSVQVLHNPDQSTSDHVTIELERPAGMAGRGTPPAQEQQALDQLVNYLSGRYMQQQVGTDGQTTRNGVINDDQGLVTDRTRQASHVQQAPEQGLPAPVRQQVEHINRHGGRGRFTPRQAAEDFAPRDVPRQKGETDKIAALKDVASGFLNRTEKDPYHAVQKWPDQGQRVGRYGVAANHYRDWLKGLTPSEIQQMIKDGKLPKGALELQQSLKDGKDGSELTGDAKNLNDFLTKMQSGQDKVSNQEIDKFLPKELQERMGTDMVKSYALATADKDKDGKPALVNVGKVALSMVLGHAVTDEEANQPQNKAIMDAAYKQYALAVEHEQNGHGNVDMSNAGHKITSVARADVGRALWQGSGSGGNLGCASSVSAVLREANVSNVHELSVHGLSGALRRQGFTVHNFNERQPGDVIIVDGGSHGHTGVVGENVNITYDNHSGSGRWSPDSPDFWVRRARGSQFYVLRPPSNA